MYGSNKITNLNFIRTILILWSVIFTACELSFSIAFNAELQVWQIWADAIVAIIFTADIIYQIMERRKDKKAEYQLDEQVATSKYKSVLLFIIDILACIPFDIIIFSGLLNIGHSDTRIFSIFRLVKIFRIAGIFSKLCMTSKLIRVEAYIIFSLMAVHTFACMWAGINPIPEESNITSYYIESIYWAVTTMTTVGYGDIVPTTDGGRILTMAVMLVGVGFYGLLIGNISSLFAESARFKEQTREKLSELSMFMRHYHVPTRLQESVFSYYNHLISKRLSDNDTRIISDLPQSLKSELQIYMNIKLIRNLPMIKGCSQACIKAVAKALVQESYAPGFNVTRIGEDGKEMFIIGHGVVEVLKEDGSIVATLHEGQFFGEMALYKETTRSSDVRAKTYCDLYKLEQDAFFDLIKNFPELRQNIEMVIKKRSTNQYY